MKKIVLSLILLFVSQSSFAGVIFESRANCSNGMNSSRSYDYWATHKFAVYSSHYKAGVYNHRLYTGIITGFTAIAADYYDIGLQRWYVKGIHFTKTAWGSNTNYTSALYC